MYLNIEPKTAHGPGDDLESSLAEENSLGVLSSKIHQHQNAIMTTDRLGEWGKGTLIMKRTMSRIGACLLTPELMLVNVSDLCQHAGQ